MLPWKSSPRMSRVSRLSMLCFVTCSQDRDFSSRSCCLVRVTSPVPTSCQLNLLFIRSY